MRKEICAKNETADIKLKTLITITIRPKTLEK